MNRQSTYLTRTASLVIACGMGLLTACGGGDTADTAATSSSAPSATEQGSATPRLALSYDGGILVLDAKTLEQVSELPADGFIRLNTADDGRHVFVSESDGFRVLDMGTWSKPHGDHKHYYTGAPQLTDIRFGGEEPGHVVPHDDRITLFSDGTGQVDVIDPAELSRGPAAAKGFKVDTAHHGVAVTRADGSIVVTRGTEDARTGIAILDGERREIASNDDCPGVHGEAAAQGGALTFGCQDGILVVRRNTIQKVKSPDPYGRIGNQAGSDASPFVLGDYKTDKDAELERPNRFTLTDTRNGTLRIVPFPASYSFRSIERGPNGEAVILGTDGALHVYDPATAAPIRVIPAIGAWTEPDEWQSAMPNVHVQDDIAYVTDPQAKKIVAVDLANGKTVRSADLPKETIELTGVTG